MSEYSAEELDAAERRIAADGLPDPNEDARSCPHVTPDYRTLNVVGFGRSPWVLEPIRKDARA